jgi:hypothetical protein
MYRANQKIYQKLGNRTSKIHIKAIALKIMSTINYMYVHHTSQCGGGHIGLFVEDLYQDFNVWTAQWIDFKLICV